MKNVDARTCNKANTRAMPAALCLLACLLLACFAPARAWAATIGATNILDADYRSIVGQPVDINTLQRGIYVEFQNTMGTESACEIHIYVDGVQAGGQMLPPYADGCYYIYIPGSALSFAPNSNHNINCTATVDGVTYPTTFQLAVTGNDETGTGDAGQGTTDTNGGSAGGGGAGSDGTTNVEQVEEGNAPATPDASTSADAPSEEFDGSLSDEGSPASNPAQTAARRDVANDSDLGEATSVSDLSSNGMGDAASTLLAAGGAFSAYAAQPAMLTGAQLLEMGGVFSLSGAMKQPEEEAEQPEDEAVDAIDVELFGVPLLFALLCALLGGAAPFGLLRRGGMFAFHSGSTSRLRGA